MALAALLWQGFPASGTAAVAYGASPVTAVPATTAPFTVAIASHVPVRSTGAGRRAAGLSAGEPAPGPRRSRAGSPQGEGRPRPGRPDYASPDPFAGDDVPDDTDQDFPPVQQPTDDGRERGTADAKQKSGAATDGRGTGNTPDTWGAHPVRTLRDRAGSSEPAAAQRPSVAPGFRPLPFGSGLILIGLGLGFIGIRLRRA